VFLYPQPNWNFAKGTLFFNLWRFKTYQSSTGNSHRPITHLQQSAPVSPVIFYFFPVLDYTDSNPGCLSFQCWGYFKRQHFSSARQARKGALYCDIGVLKTENPMSLLAVTRSVTNLEQVTMFQIHSSTAVKRNNICIIVFKTKPGSVTHTCNPQLLRRHRKENCGMSLAQGKNLETLFEK
jgi:hypothetical protein